LYSFPDNVKESEMGEACSTNIKKRNEYSLLRETPEEGGY
jgi:hypothetical protein